MKIMVLGGAGFIGTNFVHYLSTCAKDISDVLIVDKLTYAGIRENITSQLDRFNWHFEQADICDEIAMEGFVSDFKPDVIINFAAETHVSRSIHSPKSFTQTNIMGVQSVLQAILKQHPKTLLIHVSTDEVFGQQSEWQRPWSDYDCLNPRSPYAASKAAGELLVRSYFTTYGIDAIVVRPSNCFGPFQFPEKLIPRAVTNLIDGKKIPLMGAGLEMRDWLFVGDLCLILMKIIKEGKPGECFNIPGHGVHRNRDIIERILKLCNATWELVEKIPSRLAHDFKYHVAGEGIDRICPKRTDFTENLHGTIEWYRQNEKWWRPLKEEAEKGNQGADSGKSN